MADYEDSTRYEDERDRGYDRRSASPRGARDRSRSPNGAAPVSDTRMKNGPDDEEGAVNTGTNLFVTGIHPRLTEADVTRLFEKYGDVENCSIMLDPHTKESRGFGFVKMVTSDQADAAREGLQGEVIEGRTLSIEKARRARPRTPTPGKYFGPPKPGFRDARGPPRGGRFDRYDDRRYDDRRGGGGGGGYGRRYDDDYRSSRYEPYNDRPRRDDYGGRGGDRYGGRDDRDRYGGRDDRRGYEDRGGDRGGDRAYGSSSRDDREYGRGGGGSGAGGGGSGAGSGGYDREDRYAGR